MASSQTLSPSHPRCTTVGPSARRGGGGGGGLEEVGPSPGGGGGGRPVMADDFEGEAGGTFDIGRVKRDYTISSTLSTQK